MGPADLWGDEGPALARLTRLSSGAHGALPVVTVTVPARAVAVPAVAVPAVAVSAGTGSRDSGSAAWRHVTARHVAIAVGVTADGR